MKHYPLFLFFCLIPVICFGGGRKPADANVVAKFAYELGVLQQAGVIKDLSTWEDIEALPEDAQSRLLGPPSGKSNISDVFVLIPPEKRIPVGDGLLFLVSAQPINLTKWYRDQVTNEGQSVEEKKAQLEEYDRLNPEEKLSRWCIIIGADGTLKRDEIDERDFLRICSENNFKLPPASPYRTKLSKQIDQYLLAQHEQGEVKSMTSSAPVASRVPEPMAPLPAEPTKKAASPAWWIAGLIILAVGMVFVARKKKPKA
jgi:hypothetical protein